MTLNDIHGYSYGFWHLHQLPQESTCSSCSRSVMSLSGSSSSTWNEMVNASKQKKLPKLIFQSSNKKFQLIEGYECFTWIYFSNSNGSLGLHFVSSVFFPWVRDFINLFLRPAVATNHPLEVKQPILDNTPETQKRNFKNKTLGPEKKQKTYRNQVFHQVSWTCQFWRRKLYRKWCIPASLPFLYLLSFSLVLRRFSGLSPNEIFPGWSTGRKIFSGVYLSRLSNP